MTRGFLKAMESFRGRIFWMLDFIRGGLIRRHYKDIEFILENPASEEAQRRRAEYLKKILSHASDTVPFYARCRGFTINDFPVINKSTVRNNLKDFFSADFKKSKLNKVTTSGSTGTPFTVYQDRGKRLRHTADNIYFLNKAGFLLGSRLYYLRVWNRFNKKNFLRCFIENLVMEEISELSEAGTQSLVKRLESDRSTKTLLAYASTFEALLANLNSLGRTRLGIDLKSIVSMSESLSEPAKQQLGQIFKCPVFSRYSNMENGFLAQEFSDKPAGYQINSASYCIELLNLEKDIPAETGSRGRIVVTDLFNRAMPLIRYDTGDVAIMSASLDGAPPVFKKIEGRMTDFIYNTSGTLISPHAITNLMWKYSELKQFQFIQTQKKNYVLKLNSEEKLSRENELIKELRGYLGEGADIKIEYVNEIPQLASGKRKKIMNVYNGLGRFENMPT